MDAAAFAAQLVAEGASPLAVAAARDDVLLVTELLRDGAVADNGLPAANLTPLAVACEAGSARCAAKLIDARASVNAVDVSHRTPLLAACYSGKPDCAALLLASGADLAIADKAGFSPLQMAAQEGNIECIELLVGHGASANSVSVLVAHHVVTGEAVRNMATPLLLAVQHGQEHAVDLLIRLSANVDGIEAPGIDSPGSPLFLSCYQQHNNVTRRLVEAHADVCRPNAQGSAQGGTPLLAAAQFGDAATVDLLIQSGAMSSSPAAVTRALCAASQRGHAAVVELLLRSGADAEAPDAHGRTARDCAQERGHLFLLPLFAGTAPQPPDAAENEVQAAALSAMDTVHNPPANISDAEARQALSGILQGLQNGSLAFASTDPMSEYDGHGPDVTFGAM